MGSFEHIIFDEDGVRMNPVVYPNLSTECPKTESAVIKENDEIRRYLNVKEDRLSCMKQFYNTEYISRENAFKDDQKVYLHEEQELRGLKVKVNAQNQEIAYLRKEIAY